MPPYYDYGYGGANRGYGYGKSSFGGSINPIQKIGLIGVLLLYILAGILLMFTGLKMPWYSGLTYTPVIWGNIGSMFALFWYIIGRFVVSTVMMISGVWIIWNVIKM